MERCVFCQVEVGLVQRGSELVWVDHVGKRTCRSEGVGAHYPGKEADLFWRGSASSPGDVLDLTGPAPVVHLAVHRARAGTRRR